MSTQDPSKPNHGRILRLPEVMARVGLSKATIWRKVAADTFPKPVQLSRKAVGWFEDEIDQWLDNLPRTGAQSSAAAS